MYDMEFYFFLIMPEFTGKPLRWIEGHCAADNIYGNCDCVLLHTQFRTVKLKQYIEITISVSY